MASPPGSLDYWRKFFQSANSDIFDVIDHAILVASSDCPQEFRNRRDQIAEKLYTSLLPRCFGCDRVELRITEREEGVASVKRDVEKESKVDSSNDGPEDLRRVVSNYSYDEAEALTEEIEEENQTFGEVLRIKEILLNKQDQRIVEEEGATEIGRAVNGLRKHNSKQIRHLVRTLIEEWKILVDEWVNATAAIADNSPDSGNPSVLDEEEGLPFPPLDEVALFATQTTSMQLSQFFDGMDDDGNFRNNEDLDNKRQNSRKPLVNHEPVRKLHPPRQSVNPDERGQVKIQEPVMRQMKPQEASNGQARSHCITSKQSKPANADSGPGRPPKPSSEMRPQHPQEVPVVQRKPPIPTDKSNRSEDSKLEVAKRKLHERYQEAENAKKQRTIQVMELHDIPKQAHHHNRLPNMKPKNQIRRWANGRQ